MVCCQRPQTLLTMVPGLRVGMYFHFDRRQPTMTIPTSAVADPQYTLTPQNGYQHLYVTSISFFAARLIISQIPSRVRWGPTTCCFTL